MKKTALVALVALVFVAMVAVPVRVFDSAGNQTGVQEWDYTDKVWRYHHNGHVDTLWTATGTFTLDGVKHNCVTDSTGDEWSIDDPELDGTYDATGAVPFISPATGGFTLKK